MPPAPAPSAAPTAKHPSLPWVPLATGAGVLAALAAACVAVLGALTRITPGLDPAIEAETSIGPALAGPDARLTAWLEPGDGNVEFPGQETTLPPTDPET
jgi:hypothetical protein